MAVSRKRESIIAAVDAPFLAEELSCSKPVASKGGI